MSTKNLIVPDCPIKSLGEISDLFQKARTEQFINKVVDHISGYDHKESLTIGLEGSWGSGKSSMLNFIEENLEDKKDSVIVRFNPWFFSDSSDLISQFFKHLSSKLKSTDMPLEISQSFKMLADAASIVGGIVSFINPVVGKLIGAGSKTLSFYQRYNSRVQKDVWEIKDELENQLISENKRIIVLIDDMDRLYKEEILSMLRAVRAIGNLPNMVYIMAYDRNIVAKSITTNDIDGNEYLEKIIQIVMSVPMPDEIAIFNYLMRSLENCGFITTDNIELYHPIVIYAINHLNTMRKAKQFLNRLMYRAQFGYDRLCDFDIFLLAMLEVIKPQVVELIKTHRPILEREGLASMRYLRNKQRTRALIDGINEIYGVTGEILNELRNMPSEEYGSPYVDKLGGKLSEYRCINHILSLLLDIEEKSSLNLSLTADPGLSNMNYKFRLRENESFDGYFNFMDDKNVTMHQYSTCIEILNNNQRPFEIGSFNQFMVYFVDRCCYLYDARVEDRPAYMTLLLQLTSDKSTLCREELYEKVCWLIRLLLNDIQHYTKLLDSILNDSTAVLYLIYVIDYITSPDPSYNKPRWLDDISSNYKPKFINLIAKSALSQYISSEDQDTAKYVAKYMFDNKQENTLIEAYYKLLSSDYFVVSLLKGPNYNNLSGSKLLTGYLTNVLDNAAFEARMERLIDSEYMKTQSDEFRAAVSKILTIQKTPNMI